MWRVIRERIPEPVWDDFDEPPVRSSLSRPVGSPLGLQGCLQPVLADQGLFSSETRDSILIKLVNDCEPATCGRDAQDVYDELYQKANGSQPILLGIVDTIAQTLLPTSERYDTRSRLDR